MVVTYCNHQSYKQNTIKRLNVKKDRVTIQLATKNFKWYLELVSERRHGLQVPGSLNSHYGIGKLHLSILPTAIYMWPEDKIWNIHLGICIGVLICNTFLVPPTLKYLIFLRFRSLLIIVFSWARSIYEYIVFRVSFHNCSILVVVKCASTMFKVYSFEQR